MRSSVVVLKHGVRTNLLQDGQNKRGENFVPVSLASEIPDHMVQEGAMMKAEAPPDHDSPYQRPPSPAVCRPHSVRPYTSRSGAAHQNGTG